MPRAFTAQHLLEDAEAEFAATIYRFRKVECLRTSEYTAAKLAMINAEAEVARIREHIYRNETEKLFNKKSTTEECLDMSLCPKPAWT